LHALPHLSSFPTRRSSDLFLIPDAAGNMEEDKERMVKTPWFDQEIPFHQAAELGTQKVIADHSTIGLVVTCDGSFGELQRENFTDRKSTRLNSSHVSISYA